MARGDRPFKVLAKVGVNAYKLELPGDMAISATFNVGDLSLYVEDEIDFRNLRANPFKGGRMIQIKGQNKAPNLDQKRLNFLTTTKANSFKPYNSVWRLYWGGPSFAGHHSITTSQVKSF